VREFVAENRGSLALAGGIVLVGLALGLLVVALRPGSGDGIAAIPTMTAPPSVQTTPTPSDRSRTSPAATPQPSPAPTPVPPPSPSGVASAAPSDDAAAANDAAEAIRRSIDGLGALEAHRFETQITGRSAIDPSTDQLFDMAARGALLRRGDSEDVDMLFGFQMVEPGGVASISSSGQVVLVGDSAWEIRGDGEPRKYARDEADIVSTVLPAGLGRTYVVPFADGFEAAGTDRKNGTDATRYRMTPDGRRAFEAATGMQGECHGELWTADDGRYLVAASIECTPDDPAGNERGFVLKIDVTDANDRDIVIEAPA
jgi:hypothetical protein